MGYDNTTENATEWQITIIENLITTSTIPQEEKEEVERMLFDTELKYDRANEIIDYLKDNNEPLDPREQFNKRF
jgi:hypothetical protein|tara:strand:- start:765 stop:986 length:222 start_codon:yes stop_codon:yes gene_type:complete